MLSLPGVGGPSVEAVLGRAALEHWLNAVPLEAVLTCGEGTLGDFAFVFTGCAR